MGWLAAFLLGIMFGPKLKREIIDRPPRASWPGEQPPSPPPPSASPPERPPAPPRGYIAHPEPIPESARARAREWEPRLAGLAPGALAGPELRDWRGDGREYAIIFRHDEFRGSPGIGIYAEATEVVRPPEAPPAAPPAAHVTALPGGWRPHPSPIPSAVVSSAWSLLPGLWAQGEGAHQIETSEWSPGKTYAVLFRAEQHAGGKRGVTAYVTR